MAEELVEAESAGSLKARSSWGFLLTALTVAILGALGAQSLFGTVYAWWAYRSQPSWDQTGGYSEFIGVMNAVAAPLVVALVLVMGLCVPRRLFSERLLVAVSAGMVLAGGLVGALTSSFATGLAVYLVLAGLIQVAVVALTLANASGLGYLSHGRMAKAGSGLLHLGFIVFAIVIVALQNSPAMMPVFLAGTLMLVGGSALAFYARPTAASAD